MLQVGYGSFEQSTTLRCNTTLLQIYQVNLIQSFKKVSF